MKQICALLIAVFIFIAFKVSAQADSIAQNHPRQLFIDVHHLGAGSVTFKDVAAAHAKDLAVQKKRGVNFIKYWVDEKNGDVYCLSSAHDSTTITETHRAAHGLLPNEVFAVTDGQAANVKPNADYFLDIHQLGPNAVKAAEVEKAHQKDLGVQEEFGVRFINYWVNESKGVVFCLSQAAEPKKVTQTHNKAHGLTPTTVVSVKEGK